MTNMQRHLQVICMLISTSLTIQATTLVYNLKFRRAFDLGQYAHLDLKKNHLIASALPIVNTSSKHVVNIRERVDVCNSTLTAGSIFNFKYFHRPNWWLELTTAIAKEKLEDRGTHIAQESRTGLDDIVFTGGYNFYPNERVQIVLYGLGGIPIIRTVTLAQAYSFLVGSRFYSLGAGSEISYAFLKSPEKSIIGTFQNRFIHFFSRNLVPVLPPTATINPGNLTDLLFAIQFRKKMTFLQLGYDLTMFTNQSIMNLPVIKNSPNIYRNSFYFFLNHVAKFSLTRLPLVFGVGSSYAFAKQFDIKNFAIFGNITAVF